MPAPKGHSRYGGRAKGTPNKKSQVLAAILESKGVDPAGDLIKLLPQLEPEKRADIYLKLFEYIYPKLKAIELTPEDLAELTEKVGSATLERVREEFKALAEERKKAACNT